MLAAFVLPWIVMVQQAACITPPRDTLVVGDTASAPAAIDSAISLAESQHRAHANDVAVLLALGDAYARRLPTGRFQGLAAYRQAAALEPRCPDPQFRIAQLALYLGGPDGERIAREALERILALDPEYPRAWDEWLEVYRGSGDRQRVVRLLTPFATDATIKARIALLEIEDERYDDANRLLDSALTEDPKNPRYLALRAQSALEARDSVRGLERYWSAVSQSPDDSSGVLWRQVIGIATPIEIRAWDSGIAPSLRPTWFRTFWARRNPDLFASSNHRISEHFERLRYARKHFALLNPLSLYQRSLLHRAMNLEPSQEEREFELKCEEDPWMARGTSRLADPFDPYAYLTTEEKQGLMSKLEAEGAAVSFVARHPFALSPTVFLSLGYDLRSVDSVAARVGYNLATGLDDRGIAYLRFGAASQVRDGGDNTQNPECSTTAIERWRYPWGELRFENPSLISGGTRIVPGMTFRPMNEAQLAAMSTSLTGDASAVPAPLEFGTWTAQFRNVADSNRTDIMAITTRGEAAASLIGTLSDAPVVTRSAEGRPVLDAPPGSYTLLVHALVADTLGRQTLAATIRRFAGHATVSSILLAPVWSADEPTRSTMLEHVRRDLTFRASEAVRVYVEAYGLRPADGIVRYQVSYALLATNDPAREVARPDWPGAIVLAFERTRPASADGVTVETLDLDPTKTPPGQYALRISIRDLVTQTEVGVASIAMTVVGH